MSYKNQYYNQLICSVCGEIVTTIQSNGRKPRLFTLIKRECPKCKKIRKFIIIEDLQKARILLLNKIQLNEELTIPESVVYKLIKTEVTEKKKIK